MAKGKEPIKKITRDELREYGIKLDGYCAAIDNIVHDDSKWDSNGVLKADSTVPPGPTPPGPH